MSKFKLLILSLFAVLAVSAAASASASALAYLVGNMEVLAGEKFLTLSEQVGNAILKSGTALEVTCKKTLDIGLIEAGGASSASIRFEECSVQKPSATCKVTEPILVEALDQLVTEGGKTLDSFTPAHPPTFTTLHFTNCSLVEVQVEGMVRADVEPLTMQLTNTLKFLNNAPSSTLLEAAGKAAVFTLEEKVWLQNDENWGVLD